MKRVLVFILIVSTFAVRAQSREEQALTARTYLLSHTVFGSKDSLTLEDLFARTATYGHSGGNLQTREEAITGISHNRSTYTDTAVSDIHILIDKNTAIVRHKFLATETAKDGKVTQLKFAMMLVWIREKGRWRLMGRQATKLS